MSFLTIMKQVKQPLSAGIFRTVCWNRLRNRRTGKTGNYVEKIKICSRHTGGESMKRILAVCWTCSLYHPMCLTLESMSTHYKKGVIYEV